MIIGSLCRCPVSKSLKSCAGVTFTAPVPNSGSTRTASAMTGISRSISGSTTVLPIRSLVARVVGVHRHRGVAEHRLRPGGGDHQDRGPAAFDRVADVPELDPWRSSCSTSRSESAVRQSRAPVDEPLGAVDAAPPRRGGRRPRAPPRQLPGSMVKRSRLQSGRRPRRSCCSLDARRRSAPSTPRRAPRTPRGRGRGGSCPPSSSAPARPPVWVAMPAWSMPGSQRVLKPAHPVPADEDVLDAWRSARARCGASR